MRSPTAAAYRRLSGAHAGIPWFVERIDAWVGMADAFNERPSAKPTMTRDASRTLTDFPTLKSASGLVRCPDRTIAAGL